MGLFLSNKNRCMVPNGRHYCLKTCHYAITAEKINSWHYFKPWIRISKHCMFSLRTGQRQFLLSVTICSLPEMALTGMVKVKALILELLLSMKHWERLSLSLIGSCVFSDLYYISHSVHCNDQRINFLFQFDPIELLILPETRLFSSILGQLIL